MQGTMLEHTEACKREGLARWGVGIALVSILILGAVLRFVGLDWDEGQHLHPDERFLTMVENALEWPTSFREYLDTSANPLNPYNRGFGMYVYGLLPLIVAKFFGQVTGYTGYGGVYLVGRAMSGVFDLGSILLVFALGKRLYDARVGLVGALLAALSVLNIQNAHFFTVDAMTTFFVTLTLYFAVCVAQGARRWSFIALGIAFGLAISCKINAVALLLVIGLAALMRVWQLPLALQDGAHAWEFEVGLWHVALWKKGPSPSGKVAWLDALWVRLIEASVVVGVVMFVAFWAFRLAQPHTFQGPGLFGLSLNPQWLRDMSYIQGLVKGEIDYPPSHQWAAREPVLYMLKHMVLWGTGLPLGLAIWAAWGLMAYEMYRHDKWEHLLPWAWMTFLFFYQSVQFVKPVRYLLPIYPTMALMAAYGLVWLWRRANSAGWRALGRGVARGAVLAVIGGTLFWALAFTSIYTRPVTRVAASRWIYRNIPPGASLSFELWDDPLPLNVDGYIADQFYDMVRMDLYWEDIPEKREALYEWLERVDYIILSSNRLYGSIPRLPMRYPMTTRYYEALFSGELGFDLLATFTSRPQLFGIEIVDDNADETFTVYDHPKVLIFVKRPDFSMQKVRALFDGYDLERVVRLMPRQVSQAPNGLMLSPALRQTLRQGGTWAYRFERASLANRFPLLFWVLSLLLLGGLGFPLIFPFMRHCYDGGYALAKTAGLLLGGYIPWLAASLWVLPFVRETIILALGLCVLAAIVAAGRQWGAIKAFFRERWRTLLVIEGLYWLFFAGLLFVRYQNPDLWHPVMGGEKPMDLAYLNAIIRSEYFPPYDPWFAGGYINYYYWGWVPIAALTLLTGILPTTAYNLALPMLFAMLAVGIVGVVGYLIPGEEYRRGWFPRPLRYGLLGALFVTLLGNLGELRLLWEGFAAIGQRVANIQAGAFSQMMYVARGVWAFLTQGEPLLFRPEWWYWNASRIMGHGEINEFPLFTFLYGDLHAHLMALPLTVLALGLAIAFASWPAEQRADDAVAGRALKGFNLRVLGHLAGLGIVLGALWCANAWDYPTYVGITFVMLALAAWRAYRAINRQMILQVVWQAAVVLGISVLFYYPFHANFGVAYASLTLWKGERTALGDYLLIHLPFLFVLGSYLVVRGWPHIRRSPWFRVLRLNLASQRRYVRAQRLRQRLAGAPSLTYYKGWILLFWGGVLLILLALLGAWASLVTLLLLAGVALVFFRPQAPLQERILSLLAGVGLALVLAVEWFVIKGDIGRMNTVFKFYLQVWVLWGIASAAALAWLAQKGRIRPLTQRVGWRVMLIVLIGGMASYPLLAIPAKVRDRWAPDLPITLDGMAYMDWVRHNEGGHELTLAHDAQAIRWLQEHVIGSPVIAEASLPPYRWGSRISVYTGLPTILGWDWHQRQQRAAYSSIVVDWRVQDLRELYETSDVSRALKILRDYQVGLIYVGELERAIYPSEGLTKFETMVGEYLDKIYAQGPVVIYRVRDAGVRLLASKGGGIVSPLGLWGHEKQPPAMLNVPVEELPVVDGRGWNVTARGSTPWAVLAWWLVLQGIGLAAWPIVALARPSERDRGYPLAKGVGLILGGYLLWMGASLGMVQNDLPTAVGVLGMIAVVGWSLWWWKGRRMTAEPLDWRRVLRFEALFTVAFLAWVGVRLLNPDLWHPYFGGEKMMEIAMLNAVAKSAYFPPYDPYFAGGTLNYYYYGYVLTLWPLRLSGLPPEIGFNLAVPTFFALTVLHAFWLGERLAGPRLRSWGGVLAALLTVGVGNLSGATQVVERLMAAGCAASPHNLVARVSCLIEGGKRLLQGAVGPLGFDYWYRSTRILPYTINEFPLFTFLFADLHPHLMAMPFGLLVLALGIWLVERKQGGWGKGLLLMLIILSVGALGPTNTWDLPLYLALMVALLVVWGYRSGGLKGGLRGAVWGVLMGMAALVAYGPFYLHYAPQYMGFNLLEPQMRSPAGPFREIWGLFLYLLVGVQAWGKASSSARLWRALRRWGARRLWAKLAMPRLRIVGALISESIFWAAWALGIVTLLQGPYAWPGMVLLMIPTALLLWKALKEKGNVTPWLLLFAAQGVLVGIEFVYMTDFLAGTEWRRMNTVFKFSLQAWVLMSVALGGLVPRLWQERGGVCKAAWRIGALFLLAAALVYPLCAVPVRIRERFASGSPPLGTLDGTAYMAEATYYWPDSETPITMRYDREAIAWLWDHVQGTPILIEAPVGFYREGGLRIASYTGLPTLVGAHEAEQRPMDLVIARQRDAERIYQTTDLKELEALLVRYRVRYIYVGSLEKALYSPAALAKFDALVAAGKLEVAFRNAGAVLYYVRPDISLSES